MWEITSMDTGKTVHWTTAKCNKFFGKEEFKEIAQGYAPHIVAVKIS